MKLDRNISADGRGKYGLVKTRRIAEMSIPGTPDYMHHASIKHAIELLERHGVIDWGTTPDTEFFVVRLKDHNAKLALRAYADAAEEHGDPELAAEVDDLARKSARNQFPWLKGRSEFKPDVPCGGIDLRAYRKVQGPLRYQFDAIGGWGRPHNKRRKPIHRKRVVKAPISPARARRIADLSIAALSDWMTPNEAQELYGWQALEGSKGKE